MVRIVDGEILQDDDPRLRNRPSPQNAQASPQRPAAGAGAAPRAAPTRAPRGGGGGFSLDAPPFRWLNTPPEQRGIGGVDDFEVFGVRCTPTIALAAAAATYFFGVRGFVGAAILWYIYQANQGGQQQGGAPHQQARQQRQAGARPNPLADLFGGLGLGGSQPAGGGAGSGGSGSQSAPGSMQAAHGAQAAAQHPQQAPAASGGSTAFSGRGYRLGGGS